MKNRLQIRLRGPYFRCFSADGTTIGRRIVEALYNSEAGQICPRAAAFSLSIPQVRQGS
jgi:hypothetical protein